MRSGFPGPKNPKSSATKTTTWHCSSQDAQPPLPPRRGLDYRGRVPDASPNSCSTGPALWEFFRKSAVLQGKRPWRTGKGGQNTGTAFPALRLGVVLYPRGPNDQKKFDLDQNFRSRSKFLISLEIFNLDVSISPQKIGPQWVARSKIHSRSKFSISIEISIFFAKTLQPPTMDSVCLQKIPQNCL